MGRYLILWHILEKDTGNFVYGEESFMQTIERDFLHNLAVEKKLIKKQTLLSDKHCIKIQQIVKL